MAIVTYNDNGTIKVVKFGNYVVSTDAGVQKKWGYVGSFSDQPTAGTYDLLVSSDIGDKYENGIYYLYDNYPLFGLYESDGFEWGQASVRLDVTVSEGDAYNETVIMSAFRTQYAQFYYEAILGGYRYNHIAIKVDDGLEASFWKLGTTGDYPVGFVVIIDDLSTLSYFKYVVDAI